MSIEDRNRYFDTLFATPGLLWLGQNTNHIPPHPAVVAAMKQSIDAQEFTAYAPPLGFEALRAAIVADMGVAGLRALVTEGGVSALSMICRARCRPGTNMVTTDPTWKWPCLFAEQAGAQVRQIPIYNPAHDYRLTPDQLAATVDENTALIYLVDPNNPLGVTYTRAELEAFVAIAHSVGALFVHDCTYRDFAASHTPVVSISTRDTVVTSSFSKWLGLAGMRIGALVAEAPLMAEFAAHSPGVLGASVIAQRAAQAGLAIKAGWMETVRAINLANQAHVHAAVAAIPGLHLPIYPSNGNFLVVETPDAGVAPEALVECYRQEGIMIRQGTYHSATFGHRFIKISTSVPEDWITRFCDLLPTMVARAREMGTVSTGQF
ncbi:aspartate aminotransferase [Komagataeibacter rhaeticus]|uniref:pyridoxal phosphate-dependent aminotransferase n=1 Tax=Komagataeibacter rhaeticus TaxID=215221 RepID=UPI0004D5F9BF|nr:pyridoxal phosphate-dependent aminotransferase [Komagataeibacter rhaeticus]KDU96065.1 aspartate aminotransferase [Komagataeibacter rhaeticus AF1]MBL7238682.1 pyridoxal phosphate-dependent aminotransferase [Komagataeibacter rhaeticus]PYD52993.1 aspartate aminotransferase [Komagataeibacter rhaeticus]GBQ09139.1 aspartate/tyrosine/aromatic aminotransferase [Komagataeibacter rhaeticus DSM 16663]